jgi:hypothetical protein
MTTSKYLKKARIKRNKVFGQVGLGLIVELFFIPVTVRTDTGKDVLESPQRM